MTRPALKAVQAGQRSMTVAEAAATGSHRDLLGALQARLALAVEDSATPPVALAALSLRLMDVSKEIAALDATATPADGRLSGLQRFERALAEREATYDRTRSKEQR